MASPTDTLMAQLLEVHEAEELVGPVPLAYVARSGGAMTIIGGHTGWGWCWCQPIVTQVVTGCQHVTHPQVTHRRVADMSDAAYDALDRADWRVDREDGAVYPKLQDPVS